MENLHTYPDEVICHNCAYIQDIHKVVSDMVNITSYNNIILVTGGNACESQTPPAEIVDKYKELIRHMKHKMSAKEISVSSVILCVNSDEATDTIKSVNAGLLALSDEHGVCSINNDPSFYLNDGSVNDGYFLNDVVHITHKATNRLAVNLKLDICDPQKGACKPRKKNNKF